MENSKQTMVHEDLVKGRKEYKAFLKEFGDDSLLRLLAATPEDLQRMSAECSREIIAQKEDMENHPDYERSVEILKAFRSKFRQESKPFSVKRQMIDYIEKLKSEM